MGIEMKSKDLQFLGDTFGKGKEEVVVPAMVSKQDGTIRIATKKFVKKMPTCTGTPKAITASIKKAEEVVLTEETQVADHNLVKMRAALNMITGQISEADKPEQVEGMKVWHKLVQEKFAEMNLNDKDIPPPMQSRQRAVEAGIN